MTTDLILNLSENGSTLLNSATENLFVNDKGEIEYNPQLSEILFITSFPPRECGIATYSQDLVTALNNQFDHSFTCSICALESATEQHQYKQQPKFILNTDSRNSFAKKAFLINKDEHIKHVVMQH